MMHIIVNGTKIKWYNILLLNTLLHASPKGVLHTIYPLWVVDDIRALFSVGIYYQSNPIAISQNRLYTILCLCNIVGYSWL